VARPGTVLAADSVWDVVGDSGQFEGSFAGARRLKGIKNEVKVFRVRRGNGSGAD
jgi:adenylate cyclase